MSTIIIKIYSNTLIQMYLQLLVDDLHRHFVQQCVQIQLVLYCTWRPVSGPAPQRVERLEVAPTGDDIMVALNLFASLLLTHLPA